MTRLGLACLLVAAAGCVPRGTSSPPPVAPPKPIDDRATVRRLEGEASRLIASGKFTPMATLIQQLARTQCSVRIEKASRGELSPSEVYAQMAPSVLVVASIHKCTRCPRWHAGAASGFLISPTGAFVTNYHVVNAKDKHTLAAMTHDGRVFAVREVLAASEADDVAICQLEAGDARFQPLAVADGARVGEPLTVISHPSSRFYTFTRGMASRYSTGSGGGKTVITLLITADFARGSSGGPVFDRHGAVVGFVRSTHSIYYKQTKDKQENLQMVFKQCAPSSCVLRLVQ